MNEAIKLAIEGGYNDTVLQFGQIHEKDNMGRMLVLDPLFWQALGKALGKENEDYTDDPFADWKYWEWWKGAAHHYCDFVLTGGDTEKFWSDLLTKSQ